MTPETPVESQELLTRLADERAVLRVVTKLAHAQDGRDFAAYRACFTDRVWMDQPLVPGWTPVQVSADEWTATVQKIFRAFDVTQHCLFNPLIDVKDDEATCEVNLSAFHQAGQGDKARTCTVGGNYSLGLVRTDHGWRINRRSLKVTYMTGDVSMAALFAIPAAGQ